MTEVPHIDATDVPSYLNSCNNLLRGTGRRFQPLFRGQADSSWEITPSVGRLLNDRKSRNSHYGTTTDVESVMFKRACNAGAALFPDFANTGSASQSAWRKLVIMQHYRLSTRLLDWTSNPLVALFFAFYEPNPAEKCAVHLLINREGCTLSVLAEKNPSPPKYEFNEIGVFDPPFINPRVSAQASRFTVHRDPCQAITADATIELPRARRDLILRELDVIGVNDQSLFPDLDGIARYVVWESESWAS